MKPSNNAFHTLARAMARLERQRARLRDLFIAMGTGRHAGATVYTVRRHRVAAHWRAEHIAVRANNKRA